MINIVKNQGQKIIELGCGANPHPQADCKVDVRHIPGVTDFTADFNQPLPIASSEWDVILSIFAIEHISYRNVPQFLSECLRILKPGGTAIIVLPNTAAQLDWIRNNPTGWDNKNLFESASEKLFGSQNMPDDQGVDHNTHKAYFSPAIAMELFTTAGFIDVRIQPYGARATDMCVSAVKPVDDPNPDKNPPTFAPGSMGMPDIPPTQFRQKERPGEYETQLSPEQMRAKSLSVRVKTPPELLATTNRQESSCTTVNQPEAMQQNPHIPSSAELTATASLPPAEPQDPPANASVGGFSTAITSPAVLNRLKQGSETVPTPYNPERMFNRSYFDGGNGGWGGYAGEGYRDFPVHNVIARNVLERKPESVLELGCSRGYVLKRLQDAGIPAYGVDASEHCYLTRVCRHVSWGNAVDEDEYDREVDLCFSIGFLDHIPPNLLPQVVRNMASVCKRGLHGVNPDPMTDGDRTRLSAGKSLVWWKQLFATHAPGWPCEVVLKSELETAKSPDWAKEWMEGDGRLKLNVGCYATMFYKGWVNIDQHDLDAWAAGQGYQYRRHDLRNGIPYPTGCVDLIFAHHFLEHLSYKEGSAFLRECRRVLRPTGALRIVVPNLQELVTMYYLAGDGTTALETFDEMNAGCAEQKTDAGKLWSLLCPDHKAGYDSGTLEQMLEDAGFSATPAGFRGTAHEPIQQILKECIEMEYGGTSLFMDAVPAVG